ncbi:hypothetical protein LEMLEM_LOCUS14353 [Lemmus lemmus]
MRSCWAVSSSGTPTLGPGNKCVRKAGVGVSPPRHS